MKRMKHLMLALALCVGLVAGTAGQASALDVNVSGVMDYIFGLDSGNGFMKGKDAGYEDTDTFYARFRSRMQVELAVSENLKGVLQFQAGTWEFGKDGNRVDGNHESATIRRAYLDWTLETMPLNLKIGLQQLSLPGFVAGNPLFDANVAAVVGTYNFNDNAAMSLFWARPFADNSDGSYKANDVDVLGLVFDGNFGMVHIAPWAAYATVGNNSGYWEYMAGTAAAALEQELGAYGKNSRVWAAGFSAEVKPVDPLSIKFDAMYAKLDNKGRGNGFEKMRYAPETDGWFVAASVDYQFDGFTPGIFAWYASGDDKGDAEKGQFGRMPLLGPDGGFYPTRLSFPGAYTAGHDTWLGMSGVGTMGIGIRVADISFVENLSHTFRLAYIRGTNDKFRKDAEWGMDDFIRVHSTLGWESVYLTKKDYAIEVNFDSEYQIYENLIAVLELGYIYLDVDNGYRNNDMVLSSYPDPDDWTLKSTKYSKSSAYNAQFTLRYSF